MRISVVLTLLAALAACGGPAKGRREVLGVNGRPTWDYETLGDVPHGGSWTYYPGGEVRTYGRYEHGQKHGRFYYMTPDQRVERQEHYWRGTLVWSSDDPKAEPPPELLAGLERIEKERGIAPATADRAPLPSPIDRGPPRAYFASLDRTTAIDRIGLAVGSGGAGDGRALRASVFAHHRAPTLAGGAFGGFLQLDSAWLSTEESAAIDGRQTLELGATYHRPLLGGALSPRLGVVVPVGDDHLAGAMATAATSYQRPADAVGSLPSTVAVRTGASWVTGRTGWVAQADAGVDWAMGGSEPHLRPLARLNLAAGLGVRSLLGTVELSNTARLDEPGQRLHALGVGGTVWLGGAWGSALVSRSSGGHTTGSLGLGYEF